jgi:hypothetical protein
MRMSACPEQVREKQDYHESASRFELFEEARQKVSEDKNFEPGCQGRNHKSKWAESGKRFRRRLSEERDYYGGDPRKNEQDQSFIDHSLARCCFWRFAFVLFAHNPKIANPIRTVERNTEEENRRLARKNHAKAEATNSLQARPNGLLPNPVENHGNSP